MFKIKSRLNKDVSEVANLTSYNGYNNYELALQSIVYKRIIGDCLGSLDYKDHWSSLYSFNLIDILYKYILEQRIKGFLYFSSSNNAIAFFYDNKEEKIQEFIKGLKEVPIELYMDNDVAYALPPLFETFNLIKIIQDNLAIKIKASSLIQVKIDGIREKASNDQKEAILNEVVKAINNNTNGIVVMDSKDMISLGSDDKQLASLMEQEQHLFLTLTKLLGFPKSYFSGVVSTGLGGDNINDKEMTIKARENFYYRYLQPFFKEVSKVSKQDISPQTIAKDRFTPKELYDICLLDDGIDKEEIFKQLNLPMKKNIKSGATN
jgi:hypothetical protein